MSYKKFKVNKTLINNSNFENRRVRKNDNIFILTRDNYYFILKKSYLSNSLYFKNMFESDSEVGHLKKPIYLQKINSKYFKYIIQYLEQYSQGEEKWEYNKYMNIHNLWNAYDRWDKYFITAIKNNFENDLEDFEELLKVIHYMAIDNLYEKVKYCYDFIVNTKKFKLDDIDNDSGAEYENEMRSYYENQ